MRLLLSCRDFVFALAAMILAIGTAVAESGGPAKEGDHKPHVYVKEGDKYRAATEAEIKAASGDSSHGESGGLDFTGIKRWDLGIYTLIVFGILMFVLAKYAWPPMREGLEKRETNIKSALEQARQDNAAASALLAQSKRQVEETAAQVKGMIDEARRDADALRVSEREAAAKDIVAEKDRAKREIVAEKDAILKEVYDQSVKLAALMSEKAIRRYGLRRRSPSSTRRVARRIEVREQGVTRKVHQHGFSRKARTRSRSRVGALAAREGVRRGAHGRGAEAQSRQRNRRRVERLRHRRVRQERRGRVILCQPGGRQEG